MSKLNKYFPNFAKLPDDLRKLNNVHWNNHRTRGYTQVANVNITDTMKDAMDEAVAIGMFNTRSEFVRHAILELSKVVLIKNNMINSYNLKNGKLFAIQC